MIVLHTQIGPSQGTARSDAVAQATGYAFKPGAQSDRAVEMIEAVERVGENNRFAERHTGPLNPGRRAPVTIDSTPIAVEVLSADHAEPDPDNAVAAPRSPATLAATPPGSPIAAYVAAFELIDGPPGPGTILNTTI